MIHRPRRGVHGRPPGGAGNQQLVTLRDVGGSAKWPSSRFSISTTNASSSFR